MSSTVLTIRLYAAGQPWNLHSHLIPPVRFTTMGMNGHPMRGTGQTSIGCVQNLCWDVCALQALDS
jgi:hypothetical protein